LKCGPSSVAILQPTNPKWISAPRLAPANDIVDYCLEYRRPTRWQRSFFSLDRQQTEEDGK
jgi:hypothetical protein